MRNQEEKRFSVIISECFCRLHEVCHVLVE